MNSFAGLEIVVSPLLKDKPKLQFNPAFLGGSTRTIDEFNRWLEEQFGHKIQFIVTPNAIYCTNNGFLAIKKATSQFCSVPFDGGTA